MSFRYRHVQLLAVLSLLVLLNPFVGQIASFALIDLLLIAALVSAILACSTRRRHLVIGISLTAAMQASAIYRSLADVEIVSAAHSALGIVFFGYVTSLILVDVFKNSVSVTLDTICGSLAGYLLIGIGWAFIYALLDQLVPGSIEGLRAHGGVSRYSDYLSYSFVTLTTLGYGNVIPGNAQADAFASSEAIVGQIYLTVLVARLVALNLVASRTETHDS